jgi:hypothetical protein
MGNRMYLRHGHPQFLAPGNQRGTCTRPGAQRWNHLPHALDGRSTRPHPHFLSAPQGAHIIFLTASKATLFQNPTKQAAIQTGISALLNIQLLTGISAFAVADQGRIASGVQRLQDDLTSGDWLTARIVRVPSLNQWLPKSTRSRPASGPPACCNRPPVARPPR